MSKCLINWVMHDRLGPHDKFRDHLDSGGKLYRKDDMNKVYEVITREYILEREGCTCGISKFGCNDLTIIGYDENQICDQPYIHDTSVRPSFLVNSAILHKGKIWTGMRHFQIMNRIHEKYPEDYIRQDEQGFITDTGIFAGRSAAMAIAIKSNQMPRDYERVLLSENLW